MLQPRIHSGGPVFKTVFFIFRFGVKIKTWLTIFTIFRIVKITINAKRYAVALSHIRFVAVHRKRRSRWTEHSGFGRD